MGSGPPTEPNPPDRDAPDPRPATLPDWIAEARVTSDGTARVWTLADGTQIVTAPDFWPPALDRQGEELE